MIARIVLAWLALAPLLQAQVVEKLNGALAGSVSRFTWTPDGGYVLYGAARDTPDIDVLTSVRMSDRSEVVYDPYSFFFGSAHVSGLVFLPDEELVGVSYFLYDGTSFPPQTASSLHVFERATALPVTVIGAAQPSHFFADGRMLFRTVLIGFHGSGNYERAWSGRWDVDVPSTEISPPVQPDNHVSQVLPAPRAGVAVFGWRDTVWSTSNAELLAVPIGGGAPVPLTPPPSSGQRTWVDTLHVRSSDELVLYVADETNFVSEIWAVPVDGSLLPRRLNPPLVPGRSISNSTVSPDETHVVFVSDVGADEVYELWSTEIDDGTSERLSRPMTTGGDVGSSSFWISPDSARVVYRADQRVDEVFELYSAPIDGHAPAVRLHPPLSASEDTVPIVRFTPDGSVVVFAIRASTGVALLAAPSDASQPPVALNWPFPPGGGLLESSSGMITMAPGGRHVFFLGEQDTDGVVELYSAPIDASAPPRKWNAPLVPGGNVHSFALRPRPGAVLYLADQDTDQQFELYLSSLPETLPPPATSGAPTGTASRTVP